MFKWKKLLYSGFVSIIVILETNRESEHPGRDVAGQDDHWSAEPLPGPVKEHAFPVKYLDSHHLSLTLAPEPHPSLL